MRFSLLLLIYSFPIVSFGQMLLNKNGEQLSENVVFNPAFIWSNKIKSINGRFTYKREGSVMRETNFWKVFEFDTLGRIIQSYDTRKDDGTSDTVWTKYFYNDKGLLIYQSVGNKEFFIYTTTVYNGEKRIVSIEQFQRKHDIYGIPVTKEELVERFSYEKIDGKLIKTQSNKHGTAYAKITPFYNNKGQLIREENRYITTNEGFIYRFDYDNNGNLMQKRTTTSKQEIQKESSAFKYDEKGKLMEKLQYAEDKLKMEIQFIHSESTGFLSAILYQEGGSRNITILRIKEYEFY
jgi:YD repeat-containing protein